MKNLIFSALLMAATTMAADHVKTTAGVLEGTTGKDASVRLFAGVAFAAPPVGDLRWKAPQPVPAWTGVKPAKEYGKHCMQGRPFNDILFRGPAEASEDCLYLSLWTPAKKASEKLPVYVWFHGGGFAAGSGDEPRYDGEAFARQGIIVVSANYRLGIFGFLAHPELTKESPHKSSGNYGLLDQMAALQWVQKNIAAFGGDPKRVTIGGESAGSLSVSALMASPLTKTLFQQAIGESGAFFGQVGGRGQSTLEEAEKAGAAYTESHQMPNLAAMRAKPADELLAASLKQGGGMGFWPIIDGWFLHDQVPAIFAKKQQAQVPLLAGWNADEIRAAVLLNPKKPTVETLAAQLKAQFKDKADQAMKVYAAANDAEAATVAGDLASDLFIVSGTWQWLEAQVKSGLPVYRFRFDKRVPIPAAMKGTGLKTLGSAHAAELEYVFRMLSSKEADWQADDEKAAELMNAYWANFIKTGNPSGKGLAPWPEFGKSKQVMHLDTECAAKPEQHRDRYEFLQSLQ